eukprot:1434177-Pyramimonas_sp.AAC.2
MQHQCRVATVLHAWAQHPKASPAAQQTLPAFARSLAIEGFVHPAYERVHTSTRIHPYVVYNSFGGSALAMCALARCEGCEVRTEWWNG